MSQNPSRFLKWIEGDEWNQIPWNLRQQIFSAGDQKLPNRILPEENNESLSS